MCRPEMEVVYVETGVPETIGFLRYPWNLCSAVLDICDANNNKLYEINGSRF